MAAVIESRVAPREILQHDVLCHTCCLRVQREARRMSTVNTTRSQLNASSPQEEPQVLEELQVSQSEQATPSIDEVTLPDYRRAANTNHHCVFPNCESTTLHSISDKLRAIILSDYKYYLPKEARICNDHLMANM